MAKKHRHEEHVNHEAWAIPYGDLVTLLLAFFVVMYSISSVNEGKYRVLSQSMVAAFNGTPKRIQPIQVGEQPAGGPQSSLVDAVRPTEPPSDIIPRMTLPGLPERAIDPPRGSQLVRFDSGSRDDGAGARQLESLATEIERAMAPLIADELIMVRRNEQWLEVEIKTDILFPSAVAAIAPSAQAVLDELAAIFARFPNAIRVEGYTDDRPINTSVFPSNWELSAARAASVVRRFAEHGVAPERLNIVGWGEQRPAAPNESEAGRNRNRRVLIVVLGDAWSERRVRRDPAHALDVAPAAPAAETETDAGAGDAAEAEADASPQETGQP